mmetsp:Transcript_29262/g.68103  ORF Transcript_29262/g.68103 Transcript_29262/m.68103 type:complete len:91 (+) Transcript_29262:28-300(+)
MDVHAKGGASQTRGPSGTIGCDPPVMWTRNPCIQLSAASSVATKYFAAAGDVMELERCSSQSAEIFTRLVQVCRSRLAPHQHEALGMDAS